MKIIKLLLGGSPCTHWSIAQKNRETEASGIGWELFLNYKIAREKYQPVYFLYENNRSISPAIQNQITEKLGVKPIMINSALVSAQYRQRLYWTNISGVCQPEDKGLYLRDVIQPRAEKERYRYTERAKRITGKNAIYKLKKSLTTLDEKAKCLTCGQKATNAGATTVFYTDGEMYIVTPTECKRLQTVPDSYVLPVSDTQAYKMLGNGWTVDVIAHILGHIPGIATEPVEVLSMYDGMSCGHIALDKLGANVIRYYATEIDKYAIKTTMENYPDTVQMGDAFQVRDNGWKI